MFKGGFLLISVEAAQDIILQNIRPTRKVIFVSLKEALGHFLGQDIFALEEIPPFTNTSMDGYALRAEDTQSASESHPVTFTVLSTIRAGHPRFDALEPGQCFKIMTGAPVPPSADAVVPVEWSQPGANSHTVRIVQAVHPGAHLRFHGEDMSPGQLVIHQGTRITPPIIGMLATLGIHQVPVIAPPRVAILATGDELREPDEALTPGTIRNSNSYAIYAAVQEAGGQPILYPSAPDDPKAIRAVFQEASQTCDLLVSSGGVSVGDFDFVKAVIEELGHLTLWRVNLKPGKPVAFGEVKGIPIIGLPGNPVSALVTFELFVRPAIRILLGDSQWKRPTVVLPLAKDFSNVEDRRQYVRCRILINHHKLALWPHDNQGSAVQTSWQDVDGLMIVPENTGPYRVGDQLPSLLLSLHHIQSS